VKSYVDLKVKNIKLMLGDYLNQIEGWSLDLQVEQVACSSTYLMVPYIYFRSKNFM